MPIRFRNCIALTADIERSKAFYRDVIGLGIKQDAGTFVLFEGEFAIHDAGLFRSYIGKAYGGEMMGRDNLDLYFTTDDLPSVEARLQAAGVEFIHSIRKCAWGESVLRVRDPDGHVVEIGDAD